MITKISRSEEVKAKLERDGKVSLLDKPEHVQAIAAMNEQLAAVRRDYQKKDKNSQIKASSVILTA